MKKYQIKPGDTVVAKNRPTLFVNFPSLTKGKRYEVTETHKNKNTGAHMIVIDGMPFNSKHFTKVEMTPYERDKKRLMEVFETVISGCDFRTVPGNGQLAKDVRFMVKMYDKGGRWKTGRDHAFSTLIDRIFKPKTKKHVAKK